MIEKHISDLRETIAFGGHCGYDSIRALILAYREVHLRLALYEPTDPKFKVGQVVWVTNFPEVYVHRPDWAPAITRHDTYTGAMTIRRTRYVENRHQYSNVDPAITNESIVARGWRDEKYLSKLTKEQVGYDL